MKQETGKAFVRELITLNNSLKKTKQLLILNINFQVKKIILFKIIFLELGSTLICLLFK